jgi:hypothetical protein
LNSPAVGYLEKKSESWFRNWTEKFCVLTNVGLLYYDDPQKRPSNLFSTIDASIVAVSEATYSRKYVFQMKSLSFDITFAAKKKEDYDMWMQAFNKLKEETDKKKAEIIKRQRI